MTATELERYELHKYIMPLPDSSRIIKNPSNSQTHYPGKTGEFRVAHLQCGMGSISADTPILKASKAIQLLNPKFLLMMSIAFRADGTKQKTEMCLF